MAASPWKEPDDFVFPSRNRKTPISGNVARDALYRALGVLGIIKAERTRRCLGFHGWRAFLNSRLIHEKVPKAEVQKVIGHVTDAMTEDTYFRLSRCTTKAKPASWTIS